MIRELQLQDFRGFSRFKLGRLGRVNLLVGTNNSGKTSFLEAIELLHAHGDAWSIWASLSRRGERVFGDDDRGVNSEFDVSHLFHGHSPDLGATFSIVSKNDASSQQLGGTIVEIQSDDSRQEALPEIERQLSFAPLVGLQLKWNSSNQSEATLIPLTEKLGLSADFIRRRLQRPPENRMPLAFVTTESLSTDDVIASLSSILFESPEDLVLEALRIIDPTIERIAPVVQTRSMPNYTNRPSQRGGVVVKCKDIVGQIPIGTMGDGIGHLLSLALSLVRARGGVLLIDEIDTGLHYSVMVDMWRLVQKTAKDLNIQVFATTHSRDCWEALAAICSSENGASSEVTIQRIERDKTESVPFTEREIVIAAESGIEVR